LKFENPCIAIGNYLVVGLHKHRTRLLPRRCRLKLHLEKFGEIKALTSSTVQGIAVIPIAKHRKVLLCSNSANRLAGTSAKRDRIVDPLADGFHGVW